MNKKIAYVFLLIGLLVVGALFGGGAYIQASCSCGWKGTKLRGGDALPRAVNECGQHTGGTLPNQHSCTELVGTD